MTSTATGLPPHSIENEQAVLGCILSAPDQCASEIIAQFHGDPLAFYDLRHQEIFRVIVGLHRKGAPIDCVTVYQSLKDSGTEEKAGGIGYVSSLPETIGSLVNHPAYTNTVREKFLQRLTLQTTGDVASQILQHPTHVETILRHGAETFAGLHRDYCATSTTVIDAADYVAAPRIVPPEIVSGLMHQGSKMVLGGGSKSFKTWTLLDQAVSVSHGADWLGFSTIKSRVLYVNLEIQPAFFSSRVSQVSAAKGITLQRGQLLIRNMRGQAAHYKTLVPEIERTARGEGIGLIILDPIYKLYGGSDENSAGDVAQLLNELERLAVSTGAAVSFGAHFSKGNQAGKESIDRISGSGVFARDPDSILIFTRHEEENAFTVEATLRNLAPVDPFVVRWQFPLMRPDGQLDPARLKQAANGTSRFTPEQLIEALNDQHLTTEQWCKSACNEFGMSRRTFYDLHKRTVKRSNITQNKQRQWYLKS